MKTIHPLFHGVRAALARACGACESRLVQFISKRFAGPDRAEPRSAYLPETETIASGPVKILVALDDQAGPASRRGAMLAETLNAQIEVMTARPTRLGLRTAAVLSRKRVLDRVAISGVAKGGPIDSKCVSDNGSVSVGTTACAVAIQAAESNADLVVVDARRRERFARFFSRNLASKLLQQCRIPLLFVGSAPRSAYRHVVVATDFSNAANDAASMAIALAPQARFTFVHAVRMQDEQLMHELGLHSEIIRLFQKKACEAGLEKLHHLAAKLGVEPMSAGFVVEHGSATYVIGSCARRVEADLVCVGKHRRSWFEDRLVNSVGLRLLRASRADLLVVPPSLNRDNERR